MGIPTFFNKLIKESPKLLIDDTTNLVCDNFYIDFNAIVYNVLSEVTNSYGTLINDLSNIEFENILLPAIILHLENIICNVVKPQKKVYISIDGVPPLGKVVKQRSRRYKTLYETNFKKSLEKKYKVTIPMNKWSSASISPGTIFMDKLSRLIINSIKSGTFNKHINRSINKEYSVYLSSYKEIGEGEHKILHQIRSSETNGNTFVMSPDADLIVLLLMTSQKNLYIFRQETFVDKDDVPFKKFVHLSIDKCYEMINNNLNDNLNNNLNIDNYIQDYAFLTFLCGNDFVMSPPFLKIKENGLELLENIYKKISSTLSSTLDSNFTRHLIVNGKVDYYFLKELFKELSLIEQESQQKIQRKMHFRRKENLITEEDSWSAELLRFQHNEYYNPNHPQYDIYNKLFNKIDYYNDNWSNSYETFFELDNDAPKKYVESLLYCYAYYSGQKFSWDFYYNYRNVPTFKSVYSFLESLESSFEGKEGNKDFISLNCNVNDSKAVTPFQLLLMILPNKYHNLVPKNLRSFKNDEHFKIDVVQGQKFIYSEAILPDLIIPELSKFTFTQDELKRNTNY